MRRLSTIVGFALIALLVIGQVGYITFRALRRPPMTDASTYSPDLHRLLDHKHLLVRSRALRTYSEVDDDLSSVDVRSIVLFATSDRFDTFLEWALFDEICHRHAALLEQPFVQAIALLIQRVDSGEPLPKDRAIENLLRGLSAIRPEYREYADGLSWRDTSPTRIYRTVDPTELVRILESERDD